jgi:proline iminopeptidase
MKPRHRIKLTCFMLLQAAFLGSCSQSDSGDTNQQQNIVADTGSVAAGKFRLRYQIEGTGTPTIVIGIAAYYPRVFSQNLREHLRMVFLDHRGFAPSPGPVDTSAFALDSILDDVERARQQLSLGRVAVVGHSGHAFMALEYAKKYPENVSHVIMIGIAPDFGAENAERIEQNWQETASAERKAAMAAALARVPDAVLAELPPAEAWARGYIRNAPRIWFDAQFDATPLFEGVEANMDMINHVWGRTFADIDVTRGLESFDRPVFMALGRKDYIVAPPSTWDPIRSMFQDLTIRVYERSGHTPQYEEAALFDEDLLDWMSSHE